MTAAPRRSVAVDSSVLINFLNVDRIDLLRVCSDIDWFVTEHVRSELSDVDQVRRYEKAVAESAVREIRVDAVEELVTFGTLLGLGLGKGESATIAVAIHRAWGVAIDDATAIRKAVRRHPSIDVIRTPDIVRSAIASMALSVQEADALKRAWEERFRFRLRFTSFADLVDPRGNHAGEI